MESATALIVIDMQERYLLKYEEQAKEILAHVNEAIDWANKKEIPVIYIQDKRVIKGESVFPKFAKGLHIASAYIYHKEKASIFGNKELEHLLKAKEIKRLVLAGIDGNCCIAHSAIDGVKQGYEISIDIKDIGIKNKKRFLKTREQLEQAGVLVR